MNRVDGEGTGGPRRGKGRWGGNKRYKRKGRGECMDRVRCEVRGGDKEWAG